MSRKILFLYANQFGYHTDTYMYAKYLDKNKYDVHYFCFNLGFPIVEVENVTIHYVDKIPNKYFLHLKFFLELFKTIRKERFDFIFQVEAKFTLIIRLISLFQPIVLDIRTGDLSTNRFSLWYKNMQIKYASLFYKQLSVISISLRDLLALDIKKSTIIPLGGEYKNFRSKTFESIRLVYFGSLNNRKIHETVYGLALYLQKEVSFQEINYDIIGFGSDCVIEKLKKSIIETKLEFKVTFHGRKKIDELDPFFENCNVGIVYIPQTKGYDCQPSTKLFECLLAGMPVIATNTFENRISLKENCGVITEDNPEAFANAIDLIIKNRNNFSSEDIKNKYIDSDWKNIVKNYLEPYIDKNLVSF